MDFLHTWTYQAAAEAHHPRCKISVIVGWGKKPTEIMLFVLTPADL